MSIALAIPLSPFLSKAAHGNNVLLVRDDVIGDLLVPTSASIKWLTDNGHNVYLVLRENLLEVGKLWLPKDRLIAIDIKRYRKNLNYRYSFLKELRKIGFKLAIGSTMHSAVNSDIVRNSGATERWGYKRSGKFSEIKRLRGINKVSALPEKTNKVYTSVLEHERQLLSTALNSDISELYPYVKLDNTTPLVDGRYIHVIPDAGNNRRTFPRERLLNILTDLAEATGYKLVVTGLEKLDYTHPKVINLTGQTSLTQTFYIVANADYVVGSESGITHLGWILGKPTAMFYGRGHYGRFMPMGSQILLLTKKTKCICCDWKCIYDDYTFPCVNLDDETVKQELQSFIKAL